MYALDFGKRIHRQDTVCAKDRTKESENRRRGRKDQSIRHHSEIRSDTVPYGATIESKKVELPTIFPGTLYSPSRSASTNVEEVDNVIYKRPKSWTVTVSTVPSTRTNRKTYAAEQLSTAKIGSFLPDELGD